jgi:hypothetical protein
MWKKKKFTLPNNQTTIENCLHPPHQNKWTQCGFWVGRLERDFCFVYCFFLVAKGDKGAIVSLPPSAMNPSNHY